MEEDRKGDLIEYWLPETVLVLKGTCLRTKDKVLGGSTKTESQALLETDVDRDPVRTDERTVDSEPFTPYVAHVVRSWWRDTNLTVELTQDRRLVSLSSESQGQAGAVVLGVVSAATATASLAAGFLPGVAAGTTALLAASGAPVMTLVDEAAPADPDTEALKRQILDEAGKRSPEDLRVMEAFIKEKLHVAVAAQRLRQDIPRLQYKLAEAIERSELAEGEADARAAAARIKLSENALAVAQAQLARLDIIFSAWRNTTIEEEKTLVHVRVPIQAAFGPRQDGRRLPALTCPKFLEGLGHLGLWIVMESDDGAAPADSYAALDVVEKHDLEPWDSASGPRRVGSGVLLRQPRPVTLALYQYAPHGTPTSYAPDKRPGNDGPGKSFHLIERRRCFIVDGDSRHEFIPFRRSLWGKRKISLGLWPDGGLNKYESSAGGDAAAAGDAASKLPGAISGALEAAGKSRAEIDAARLHSLDLRILSMSRQLRDLDRQISDAGGSATEDLLAKRVRLQQQLQDLQAEAETLRPEPATAE